ncbi:MAG: hypothetical protein KA797_02300 [Chitinophagales bacterium]|nr:hypothetical protein [Chitinophagales bacterium]
MTNKKVLILAYDFPPLNSVGAQRPYSWYKYFSKSGAIPTVVTRHWEGVKYGSTDSIVLKTNQAVETEQTNLGDIIRVPYRQNYRDKLMAKFGLKYAGLRRLLTLFYNVFDLFTTIFDSKRELYFASKEYLKLHKVDYIIATGEPYILFKYASQLSEEFGIPWHADYRDDWIGNHIREHNKSLMNRFMNTLESFFEKRYLKSAKSFSTVADQIARNIESRTAIHNYVIIENGSDLEVVNRVEYNEYPSEFIITYTGLMYDFDYYKTFALGFKSFMEKCSDPSKVKLRFVGIDAVMNSAVQEAYRTREAFPNHVEIIGHVPFEKAVLYQKMSCVLLNLIAGDPAKGFIGAKCSVYAATKRPILSVPLVKNKESNFFRNRDIHTIAISPDEVCSFLLQRFDIFEKKANLETSITDREIYLLSREYQAQLLVNFLFKNDV